MGNNSGKESRNSEDTPSRLGRNSPSVLSSSLPIAGTRNTPDRSGNGGLHAARTGRPARPELGFLTLRGHTPDREVEQPSRRETRQEREARRAEKERLLRARERERSLREESVDGGYLVTLGTYVGPEDYSKAKVRQLQLERRLAPFWRGLNDHSDSWTEHQLVAAARGKPIPAPDEIPQEDSAPSPQLSLGTPISPLSPISPPTPNTILKPSITQSSVHTSSSVSGSHLAPTDATALQGKSSLGADADSVPDLRSQEIQLPQNPQINGQPIEAYLYKDVGECPICFLYYPPYLNRTRCCDQPICSECFVQIKRPDPHPPEHQDPNTPAPTPEQQAAMAQEGQLVSEEATCPFCVQTNLGVTYDPPPFRRGLAYASQTAKDPSLLAGSAPKPSYTRQRGVSISASDPRVITTDTVRPDWYKKLADARAYAARRSAAATALHAAAYMVQGSQSPGFGLGRRRRGQASDSNNENAQTEAFNRSQMEQIMAVLENQGSSVGTDYRGNRDLFPSRFSSRGTRGEDLEEMMMMEAIRLSLASEEERKKKEEKEAAKKAKRDEKNRAKEQKKVDKATRKNGSLPSSQNNSGFFTGSEQQDNRGSSPEDSKGKARIRGDSASIHGPSRLGFNPLDEPTSTVNTEETKSGPEAQQRGLGLHSDSAPFPSPGPPTPPPKDSILSPESSNLSFGGDTSLEESIASALRQRSETDTSLSSDIQGSRDGSSDPKFGLRSLAALMGRERSRSGASTSQDQPRSRSKSRSRSRSVSRSRGASASTTTNEKPPALPKIEGNGSIQATPSRVSPAVAVIPGRYASANYDSKHSGNVSVTGSPQQQS